MATDTFCPIPWNFQAVRSNGDLRVCCQANITKNKGVVRKADGTPYNAAKDDIDEARNSDLMKIMRKNMLNGIWSQECGRCKSEEETGLISRRNYEHDRWTLRIEDIKAFTADDGSIDTTALPVKYYDLRFGNLCNLACRMCGPQDSTGWYEDYHKLEGKDWFFDTHGREQMTRQNGKWTSPSYSWHDSDSFWKQIEDNIDNIQHVYMAGGEPLLIERHYEFLERCIENGAAKNMLIEYNTNMTSVSSRAINLWKNFRRIQIGASIDGYGPVLEYQRYPANWDKVWRNIQIIDQTPYNIEAWLAYTVTAYNVLHLPDFMRWKLESSGLQKFNNTKKRPIVTHHVAHQPLHLNIRVLPPQIKKLVEKKFDDFHQWVISTDAMPHIVANGVHIKNSILDYMNSVDLHGEYWPYFVSTTRALDNIRGQCIINIVPEFEDYL